jgi:hypothetical protein
MTKELIDTIAKYLVAIIVVGSCMYIISTAPPEADLTQPWSIITLIVGWLIRDSAGNTASANSARIVAASTPIVYNQEAATGGPA